MTFPTLDPALKTWVQKASIRELRCALALIDSEIWDRESACGNCPVCSGQVKWDHRGRKPTYCSTECRWAAHHDRLRLRKAMAVAS